MIDTGSARGLTTGDRKAVKPFEVARQPMLNKVNTRGQAP
jgi:hypothetical protein